MMPRKRRLAPPQVAGGLPLPGALGWYTQLFVCNGCRTVENVTKLTFWNESGVVRVLSNRREIAPDSKRQLSLKITNLRPEGHFRRLRE